MYHVPSPCLHGIRQPRHGRIQRNLCQAVLLWHMRVHRHCHRPQQQHLAYCNRTIQCSLWTMFVDFEFIEMVHGHTEMSNSPSHFYYINQPVRMQHQYTPFDKNSLMISVISQYTVLPWKWSCRGQNRQTFDISDAHAIDVKNLRVTYSASM